MVITNEKIKVTFDMLRNENMTRGNEIGIPKDVNNLSLGLVWKGIFDIDEEDGDKLEEYFIMKS